MSAKKSDLGRIQEVYDIIAKTRSQIASTQFTKGRFLDPANDEDDLMAEGILNRVLRLTEELSHIEEAAAKKYAFNDKGARGIRNRLAHAYGEVDREIIWDVIENDFDEIIDGCTAYCENAGVGIGQDCILSADQNK